MLITRETWKLIKTFGRPTFEVKVTWSKCGAAHAERAIVG